MRRAVRTVTTIVFVAIILGCAFAVIYLGTSTGMTFGGAGSELAQSSLGKPVYAQVGWLRNTAPWPVTIQSITTNVKDSKVAPTVYLERAQSGAHVSSGALPNWVLNASHTPYQLDGGALRYLGFALHPTDTEVSYMTRTTVHYIGPLGIHYTKTFSGTTVAASASAVPPGVLSHDPRTDFSALDSYIAALRTVLLSKSGSDVAAVMGNGATAADGDALLKQQAGYATSFGVVATLEGNERRDQKLVFYNGSPTTGALPAIAVMWSGFRWSVVRT
jgi:hypothetical protein